MVSIEEFKKEHSTKIRIIALDLGAKRIGVSICDENQSIATPFKTLIKKDKKQFINEYSQAWIIANLSKNFLFRCKVFENLVWITNLLTTIEQLILDPLTMPPLYL